MKIETIKTSDLIPYARNAKLHDAAQVSKLAGSIREFGFNNPVLIDKDNGIIAGHGRVMAAQKLGLDTVPCIRLGHLTDTQKRAYILADNRLAELGGGWDEEMLKIELEEISKELNVDLIGFEIDKELSKTDIVEVLAKKPPALAWVLVKAPLEKFGAVQSALDNLPAECETFTTYTDEN
jgi:ParB-like chromosome segregation protein Spo0J